MGKIILDTNVLAKAAALPNLCLENELEMHGIY